METIIESISLANAPMLTERELGDRSRDWAKHLWNAVPENRLSDSFARAFQDHTTNFPLSAYEVKSAWGHIEEEEAEALANAPKPPDPVPPDGWCPRCHNTGKEYRFDIDGKIIAWSNVKCDHRALETPALFKAAPANNVVPIKQEDPNQ